MYCPRRVFGEARFPSLPQAVRGRVAISKFEEATMPNPRHLPISVVRPSRAIFQKSASITLLLVLFCTLFATAPAAAQIVTGSISGTVTDPSGAVIPGAVVTLLNQRTSDLRKITASSEGRFVFSAVQPDTYTIKVEMQGFQALEQQNIVLSAQENLALGGLQLKTGVVTEVVEVIGQGARIDTEASDLTGRLTADQISQIS